MNTDPIYKENLRLKHHIMKLEKQLLKLDREYKSSIKKNKELQRKIEQLK